MTPDFLPRLVMFNDEKREKRLGRMFHPVINRMWFEGPRLRNDWTCGGGRRIIRKAAPES